MSAVELVLAATGSHLYSGAGGSISAPPRNGPCLVEFADGSAAIGMLAGGCTVLELGPYTTAYGTAIPARRWTIETTGAGEARRFRITGRLPSPCG